MLIKGQNLSKSFSQAGKEISVLNHLGFEIEEGETVAVVGRSGSGKSTFLSLVSGLDQADSGEIFWRGERLVMEKETSLTEWRQKNVGIIFQQFHLLPHLNALENVMLPYEIMGENQKEDQARELLGMVGLGDRADHRPGELSGGEKQRVAIARALMTKPPLILADEPSGSLDEETGLKVMNLIFDLVSEFKMTMMLVTHSPFWADKCQRKLTLIGGQLHQETHS